MLKFVCILLTVAGAVVMLNPTNMALSAANLCFLARALCLAAYLSLQAPLLNHLSAITVTTIAQVLIRAHVALDDTKGALDLVASVVAALARRLLTAQGVFHRCSAPSCCCSPGCRSSSARVRWGRCLWRRTAAWRRLRCVSIPPHDEQDTRYRNCPATKRGPLD